MKILFRLLPAVCMAAFPFVVFAQEQPADSYRRSSICLMLLDENDMPKRDLIKSVFVEAPVPAKYNDHNVEQRIIPSGSTAISESDREAFRKAVTAGQESESAKNGPSAPKKKSAFGSLAKGLVASGLSGAAGSEKSTVVDAADKEAYAAITYKHLLESRIAKQLFDKWFIGDDGKFQMELIKERGMYDASLMDVQTAKSSTRGMGMLEDAGEELINNTFVVVSRFRYMSKEELVNELNATSQAVAQGLGGATGGYLSMASSLGSMGANMALGSGYYVRITSFLFQLNWNDEIANTFYSQLWDNPDAYNDATIFSLKYIGMESAFANVKAGIFTDKPEEELISIATINAMDAVLAKLEKKYDVFKTKTPLLSVDPLTAAIGMKEGVSEGDKYEVLEKSLNEETGKTTYKRVAVIRAAKGGVCDNRYMAAEEIAATGATPGATVTTFEGGSSNLYPGMLIRQTK